MDKAFRGKPVGNRVVVLADPTEDKTEGGLYIPDTADKDQPQTGTVVAVGEGAKDKDGVFTAMQVHVDDRVMFSKYTGSHILVDGVEYLVMMQDDILVILD